MPLVQPVTSIVRLFLPFPPIGGKSASTTESSTFRFIRAAAHRFRAERARARKKEHFVSNLSPMFRPLWLLAFCAFIGVMAARPASGQAVIANASVQLGINREGNLIYNGIGLHLAGVGDGIAPGCSCEGWGVAGSGIAGTTSLDNGGIVNITPESFDSTATTATSVVHVTSLPALRVTHTFRPSVVPGLFEGVVTIANTGSVAITDVRYSRAMDWDVPPTEFMEHVTIAGVPSPKVLFSNDNGFATPNPLVNPDPLRSGTNNVSFQDSGPGDHGAFFTFGFGDLAPGSSVTFSIFYGATTSEVSALSALAAVGAEIYSLGQSNGGKISGEPGTFIFGYRRSAVTVTAAKLGVPTFVDDPLLGRSTLKVPLHLKYSGSGYVSGHWIYAGKTIRVNTYLVSSSGDWNQVAYFSIPWPQAVGNWKLEYQVDGPGNPKTGEIDASVTDFDPALHGWKFDNQFKGLFGWYGLCVGMSRESIRMYREKQGVPSDTTPPSKGTSLYKAIQRSHNDGNAHIRRVDLPRLVNYGSVLSDEANSTARVSEADSIRLHLEAGKPWVMGLVTFRSTSAVPIGPLKADNHAVVAAASFYSDHFYAGGDNSPQVRYFALYDPNFPGRYEYAYLFNPGGGWRLGFHYDEDLAGSFYENLFYPMEFTGDEN